MDTPHRRALVIGATGFLGRYISTALAVSGWGVVGLARKVVNDYPYRLLVRDLSLDPVDELIDSHRPDLIVWAAGSSSVWQSLQTPLADFRQNVLAFATLMDAVRLNSLHSRIILLSSAAVYGNPTRIPINETDQPRPISPYGFHKWMCEEIAQEYHRIYGLEIGVIRVFSAYGAGLARQVLWDISQKILVQGQVDLSGTGAETRDFVHASDVANAVVLLAENPAAFGAVPYNLASGTQTSIRQTAELLIANLDPLCPLIFSGVQRPGDPLNWQADVTRLSMLGFRPRVSLQDGIATYADWVRAQPESAASI